MSEKNIAEFVLGQAFWDCPIRAEQFFGVWVCRVFEKEIASGMEFVVGVPDRSGGVLGLSDRLVKLEAEVGDCLPTAFVRTRFDEQGDAALLVVCESAADQAFARLRFG